MSAADRIDAVEPIAVEPIAVVGLACRVPGAADAVGFWRNLRAGVESLARFEPAAMRAAGADRRYLDHPDYVPARCRLDDVELFDAAFFGFTPREAAVTDPQQRFFLETAWEALEDAGYDPKGCRGPVGVFAGVGLDTYLLHNLLGSPGLDPVRDEYSVFIGNDKDFVPTRVSYLFGLEGPSLALSTACSSSLVAVHVACQSLLTYGCDMALAGAVSIRVPQAEGYLHQAGGILSPDGSCRAFDRAAAGTVGGSGVGVVVLKRLADAERDGDRVRALILGSAINNDGAAKVGFTAPSVRGQAAVIEEALALAGVDPGSIGYVEAHGTGTALGDPVEVAALTEAFRKGTDRRGFCALGSVKTNVGHLDTAAGLAGLIKVVLALEHGELPASLHFQAPNPAIDFASSPFFVNDRLRPWAGPAPRRAGVSSFGIGGTNAHLVVEEAPASPPPAPPLRPFELVPLSARTPEALAAARGRLAAAIGDQLAGHELADLAFTLQVGRHPMRERWAAVVASSGELRAALDDKTGGGAELELGGPRAELELGGPRAGVELALLCAGQGSRGGLGTLYAAEPGLRRTVDGLCARLAGPLGEAVRTAVVEGNREPELAQPACFVLELALARLWAAWGLRPAAVAGHSLGELVAAVVCGVLDEGEALALVVERGRLVARLPAGAMLAVAAGEAAVARWLGDGVWLAAVNGPEATVLSGVPEAVARVAAGLAAAGVGTRPLAVGSAFHSGLLDPLLGRFGEQAARLRPRAPEIPWLSSSTGAWMSAEEARDPGYWVRQLREPVRFDRVLVELLRRPGRALLEVGPAGVLTGLALRHPDRREGQLAVSSLPWRGEETPGVDTPAQEHLLRSLARLWLAGAPVDWHGFQAGAGRRRVSLPTYPFERRRHWVEHRDADDHADDQAGERRELADWFYVPSWRRAPPRLDVGGEGSRAGARRPQEGPTRWLLWLDGQGLGEALARQLRAQGREARTVEAGAIDDPRALAVELAREGWLPEVVVHLGAVGPPPLAPLTAAPLSTTAVMAAQEVGFLGLVRLVQGLGTVGGLAALRLEVIATGLVEVLAGDVTCPEKATLLGPLRVIPLEHPGVRCRAVDLPFAGPGGFTDLDAATLLAELALPGDGLLALRGGQRWLESYERLRLDAAPAGAGLRPGGAYLVAGGLGGVGYEIASYLARAVGARLMLTGRRELDDDSATPASAVRSELPEREPVEWEAAIAERGAALERELAIEDVDARPGLRRGLERVVAASILEVLAAAGIDTAVGARHPEAELLARLGVVPKLLPLVRTLLDDLAGDGLLARQGDDWVVLPARAALLDAAAEGARVVAVHPGFAPLLEMLACCARHYPAALRGEIEAISVLYPDGSPDLLAKTAAAIPEHTRHRLWLTVLREQVLERVAAHLAADPGRPLRILEIGGGNGLLAWPLLEALRERLSRGQVSSGRQVEYVFTDLGRSFVAAARQRAAETGLAVAIPGLRFAALDVSRDPVAQGFDAASFDLVLELDVVHATPRIDATLAHLRRLLRPGGAMLMVETVRSERWSTMAYGLADGWWLFADRELRRGSPLLSLGSWEAAFGRQGMAVTAFPRSGVERDGAECGLIVAELPQSVATAGANETAAANETDARRRLRDLAAAGAAEVVYRRADVADRAAMQQVVDEARARFGRLDGVVHAAAIERRGAIQLRPADRAEELAAKVTGTLVLDEICRQEPRPDFLLLSSSITSQLGGVGDVEYTAANAFVDAFAQSRAAARAIARPGATSRGEATPWVTAVAWDRWRGIGMARAYEARHELRGGASPTGGMSGAEGCEVFARLVAHRPAPGLVISTVDFERRRRRAERQRVDALEGQLVSAPAHDRPALASAYAAPESELERRIAAIWQEVLGVRQVGAGDDFSELGGDSLIAIKVVARLRDELGLDLAVRALFEARTVRGLAEHAASLRGARAPQPPPLGPVPRDGVEPPLSLAQERLWFLDRMEGASAAYNVAAARRLRGPLSPAALEQALDAIGRRHETLRTTFAERGERVVQVIAPAPATALRQVDLGGLPAGSRQAVAGRLALAEAHRPFDLVAGPLVRATLLRQSPTDHLLLTTLHHAVADGWSNSVLLRETGAFYDAFRAGEPASPAPLPLQYADWAIVQRQALDPERIREPLAFWRQELAGAPPLLELPADRPRPDRLSDRGGIVPVAVERRAWEAARELARGAEASPFMVLLAGFAALLARISGQPDLVLGVVHANRTRRELEPLIGFFVDNLPLRFRLADDPSFAELVARARRSSLDAFAHQELPFNLLVEALQPVRSLAHAPLFQVAFVFQSASEGELGLAGVAVEPLALDRRTAKLDLSLLLWEADGGLAGELEYSRDLFDRDRVERLAAAYPRLLAAAVAEPARRLSTLPLVGDEERRRLESWAVGEEPAAGGHLWTRIRESARARPDAVALAAGNGQISYGALARLALRRAAELRGLGVADGEVVAVGGEPSPELLVGLVGVLAAGAAYLPLDPGHPAERLTFQLADAGVRWVLADAALAARLAGGPAAVLPLAVPEAELALGAPRVPEAERQLGFRDPAYVIYTSGSTGQPKAVIVEHRSVVNLVAGLEERIYSRHPGRRRVALVASLVFDASVQQLFAALLGGHRLELVATAERRDPERLLDLLAERQVELADCTPSLLAVLADAGLADAGLADAGLADAGLGRRPDLALVHLLVGGEGLPTSLVARLGPGLAVTNLYGPTECCVDATAAAVDPARRPSTAASTAVAPLGRPLRGQRVRVVDARGELAPVGVPGEVVIAGAGVARGYLGRPALTADRFRPDPCDDGGRLYRSGDRGRWNAAGELEYLGRDDEQVKIRGHRVELGEVEAALRRCPGVAEARAVARRRDDGWSELVAYLVASEGAEPEAGILRAALAALVPAAMIPAHFVVLDRLPLNASGKLDRARLPEPVAPPPRPADRPPEGERERRLAEVWAAVLGLESLGVEQSFFELGGDSIKALQVVARLRGRGLRLELADLFAHPTVAGLAPRLAEIADPAAVSEAPAPRRGEVPLTPIQRWFFARFRGRPGRFVQSLLLAPAAEELAPGPLAAALEAVASRHDAFRLRFRQVDGTWRQTLEAGEVIAPLEEVDLAADVDPAASLLAHASAAQAGFDLERGPLLRAVLYRLLRGQRLLLTAHHLVVDAVSWRLLLEELAAVYRDAQATLPPPGSFAAWADRLAALAAAGPDPAEAAYWREALVRSGPGTAELQLGSGLGLFSDRRELAFELDDTVTRGLLGAAHRAYRSEANELLLTAVGRALAAWSNRRRVRLLLEGHGREPIAGGQAGGEPSRAVGWHTTLFPLTLELTAGDDLGADVRAVQAALRRVPGRGLGFGLHQPEAAAGDALPAIAFNYLGRFGDELAGGPFRLADEPIGPAIDPEAPLVLAFELVAAVVDGRFRLQLLYSGRRFTESRMAALAVTLRAELEALVEHTLGRAPGPPTLELQEAL